MTHTALRCRADGKTVPRANSADKVVKGASSVYES